jgi:hypothetical protein
MRVVVEQHERHRKPVVHSGVHLHAMHEERTIAGDHHDAPAMSVFDTAESHSDAGAEAVAHATHPECHGEPAPAPRRQVMDGGRPCVAGVDDDIRPVG